MKSRSMDQPMNGYFVGMLMLIFSVFKEIYAVEFKTFTCGEKYDLDYYKDIDLSYEGSNRLFDNPCQMEFTKSSYDQFLCVRGDYIRLDCGTSLEYHEGFVKNYINPEVEMSCKNIESQEWCPSQYQDNIFVVIRKGTSQSSDHIQLRVYLKDAPDQYSSSAIAPGLIVLYVLLPIIFSLMVICVIVVVCRKQKASTSRPPVLYQTTSGAINMPPGQFNPPQSNPQPYYPLPQSELQGNYNVHPMRSAYPANQNFDSQQGNAGRNYSNATSVDPSAPPPSYESVVGQKH